MEVSSLHWPQGDCAVPEVNQHSPTVLIAEDSPHDQHWLASILIQAFPSGFLIPTTSVRHSLEVLASHTIDIAVVDLHLPPGSGIEVVQECSRMSPSTRCVITTIYDDDAHLVPVLAAGALGYLLKNQPETVLIQQMRLLAEGIPPLAPSIAARLVQHFAQQRNAPPDAAGDDLAHLSQREAQVLSLIGRGLQIAEVARLLEITTNTVCSHIKSIYRKRHVSSRAEAALEAKRLGLV